ncbi:tetratricopeptide repeat-containing hybrid sensor histidine kinase/response regulator [Aurantibacillus circumpalustris]|uniref:tetratricopeptide repeat-containing hybrid sensor histidine kinase/response regulator n=1 Tax=Aurantibacillus circumpalustris TaxID=3036359 RepID=UPI0037BF3A2C
MGDTAKAVEYTLRGLAYRLESKDKSAIAHSYNNLARIYANKNDFKTAISKIDSSLILFTERGDKLGVGSSYALKGRVLYRMKNYSLAIPNIRKGLQIFSELKSASPLSISYNNLGEAFYLMGQIDSALYYTEKGFKLSNKLGFPENIKQSSYTLSKIYFQKKKFEDAYKMHVLFKKMTDSVNSISNKKSMFVKNIQYDYQKRAEVDSIKSTQERKIFEAKVKTEKTFSTAVVSILALILIFAGFIFYRYRVSQNQKRIIELQKGEVDKQRALADTRSEIAEKQKKLIEESIKEITATQEKLRLAKEEAERANLAKTDFIANISHEIRTPLNAVLGFSELLKGSTKDPVQEKYVENILTGGKNLMSLINDILDLSKIEAGHVTIQNVPLNLRTILNECKQLFTQTAEDKKLEFKVVFDSTYPITCLVDETRIRQILFNLLGNAFKFTKKGSVSLILDVVNKSEDEMDIRFTVTDTGIGIPKDQQEIIFEAFKQIKGQRTSEYGGTGLGLAITKRLVDVLKGSLTLESKPEIGSCFSFELQNVKVLADRAQSIPIENKVNYDFRGQTLLLVEDITSNRELIKEFLKDSNIKIINAENGQEALDFLKKTKPDIIIMDMLMPVMDGKTAIKIIKSNDHYKSIPLIALTASGLENKDEAVQLLCEDYLRKPIDKKTLLVVLSKYLDVTGAIMKSATLDNSVFSEKLKEQFLPRWNEARALMSIDDILRFAEELHKFACDHNVLEILAYSERLRTLAINFEIEEMNKTFLEFENSIIS